MVITERQREGLGGQEKIGLPPELRKAASLQLQLAKDSVPWIYASLMSQPKVTLFDETFPDPFNRFQYAAATLGGEVVLVAQLSVGDEFNERYKDGIGSTEDLQPLLSRYKKHEFTGENNQGLTLAREDGQLQGVIARVRDQVVIQWGGPGGKISTLADTSVNDLSIALDRFNLLISRYVGSIWKASEETDQKKMQFVLTVPVAPEAVRVRFSTAELVVNKFRERTRPVDLDNEVGGYPGVRDVIKSLLLDTVNPTVSRGFGTQPESNKFVLVCGPERAGKSLFAKALETLLRAKLGKDKVEYLRLSIGDMIGDYGEPTATVVKTILDYVRENERNGIPTLVHLDKLEQLIPPQFQRDGPFVPPSEAEMRYTSVVLSPIVSVLRTFGREIGAQSKYVIVYGESRAPRDQLPEGVRNVFRRAFSLHDTNPSDHADILRVQIKITQGFARSVGRNPFAPGILEKESIARLAKHARGLVGGDIQAALMNITTRLKAGSDEKTYPPITEAMIADELEKISLATGVEKPRGRMGFELLSPPQN